MFVFERAYGVGESILIGQHLRSQLIQGAQALFETTAINHQFADQIEEPFQAITADPDHLTLFSGLPLSGIHRLSLFSLLHIKRNHRFGLR